MEKIIDPSICGWDTASYLVFSENVFGDFIYYSHIFPALSALCLGFFVLYNNPKDVASRILFAITVVFSMWSFFDLVLWATEITSYTMFFWSSLIHLDFLIYILSFYLVYSFLYNKLPDWKIDLLFLILFLPLILFAHTNLNLIAFDYTNCWREALEGPLWQYYVYNAELLVTLLIFITGIKNIKASKREERGKKILFVTGVLVFLLMFSAGNIAGSFNIDWQLGQYGLFGMAILAGFLGYLILKFKAFNTSILTSQLVIAALTLLVLSLQFVRKIENVRTVAWMTLLITISVGFALIRSTKNDQKQKEEIESLANGLAQANEKLRELDKAKSEFVSIASHQLRSPLTAIRGYASMLAEGSFGQMPQKALEAAKRIEESTKLMAMSIEDYLNVSRIESGNMKYNLSDFNLLEMTSKICDDLRPEALKQNLILLFRSDITSKGIVNADVGKVHQIIHNLINNSIKYTQKGSISVFVREDQKAKRIYIDISDTGIGMSQKTIDSLFQKFSRADNANSVNTSGTGLGLYVAVKMAEAMNGSISASSEGDAKGSTFTFELPLAM